MAQEWLERDDLSVYVVAGAPKGFNRSLKTHLESEVGEGTQVRLYLPTLDSEEPA